ncbi:glycoside hydrolase family 16 protein [Rhizoctonia solani AG-1 IA]|uniref:Glycoside hydrolase family 16 protein n=1 Tax=Thanatephorus cucumeris (strain AG1-IA) TaxID=983506 RepID=L8WYC1_THACA|nr:glycoside hydrolase family 16 protein [Rhizoctonia solani AG-1 IA]
MVRSITSFGAGAILVATSVLPTLVQADIHKPVHRITRHAHIRRATAVPAGWEAQGCITDAEAPNRVLSDHHTDTGMNTASCIKSCAANGYKLAGTQFGKECWCGNSLAAAGGAGQSSNGCDMSCAGDASQVCGGNYHMNLFAAIAGKNATTTTSASYSAPTSGSKKYAIQDRFAGKDFFRTVDLRAPNSDPTNGQVNYLNKADATAAGLAYVQEDGAAVIKVDNTTKLEKGQQYDGGLFVADFLHMPFGCSVWPAYWTVGDNWPNNGEIDILENVNLATANQYTLHTGPNSTCTLDSNPIAKYKSTSNMMGKTCASKEGDNAGCGFSDPEEASYGKAFNNAGGAVIAMEWTKTGIRIFYTGRFKRDSIPADLQGDATNPNPDSWGAPVASWTDATCNIANEVKKHNIVINTTLCGGWAGDAYGSSGCPGTCTDQIMEPSNYNEAYWEIKSVTVYQ